jgi:unsaturated chondroitin disaccharide hydrolase
MAIKIDQKLTHRKLVSQIERIFELSAQKIQSIEKSWKPADGTPVFTVKGKYTSRGWTEWTQGFQFGSAVLQFDATGDEKFLEIGRRGTIDRMATHVSHIGVHDHGFNNVSTYGNLLRLMHEGRIEWNDREKDFYEMALKVSGAVQASRWTKLADSTGFIHSFNGPHSLFVDTIRSCRSLAAAHELGHVLMGEQDAKISLLQRLIHHSVNTARFSVYYGKGRDAYDISGRTTHEAVFNTVSGVFRCPNSQQGFSPFTTWTRGLAWAICGFAEQLEYLRDNQHSTADFRSSGFSQSESIEILLSGAKATADFYLENCCADGIPMWDTGAPELHRLPENYLSKSSNPYNKFEPVDSSAAAIAAQGLIRLGNYSKNARYTQAGLTIAKTLLDEPYISTDSKHQGLLLHSVYHRPNGWDYISPGQKVPNGESSMWGDYHLRELGLLVLREAKKQPYLTFFGCVPK